MKNKYGFELSFGWIFSIIVGSAIIFLSLYAASQFIKGERDVQDTYSAQQLGAIFNRLESSMEVSSRPANISFPGTVRISNKCVLEGRYGRGELGVSTRSEIGEPWQDSGLPSKSSTKYIFSQSVLEGKQFSTLVKPLNAPYKIGDVITLWSDTYCFIDPPSIIEEEINSLNLQAQGMIIKTNTAMCPQNSKIVCFDSGGAVARSSCSVVVDVINKRVTHVKAKQNVYYEDSLIYGAIVSDPGIYECQVKRLLSRSSELAMLYRAKSEIIASQSARGCSSAMQSDLLEYVTLMRNSTSKSLSEVWSAARELEKSNELLLCPLWEEEME